MAIITGTSTGDTLTGGAGADEIYGLGGNDSLVGGAGNDTIDGGTGVDTMDGGAGSDLFYVDDARDVVIGSGSFGDDRVITSVSYSIAGNAFGTIGELRAVAGTAPIDLTGGSYLELIIGNDGPNRIVGGGAGFPRAYDTLRGLGGNDTYVVGGGNVTVAVEEVGAGNDLVLVATEAEGGLYTLRHVQNAGFNAEIETIAMANASATNGYYIQGNQYSQTLIGNAGASSLEGAGGADTLIGLAGNDSYYVTTSDTLIVENANEGNDAVRTTVDYVLAANASVEVLTISDPSTTGAINLTGNAGSQQITGNAGANIINGLGGADTMTGLGGNDTYLVRGPGDLVIEANGGGDDTVFTTVSYSLGVNGVERLSTVTQADTVPIDLIGNFATQLVIGNYGNNVLNGGSGGNDTLIGLFGNDVYAVGDSGTVIFENANEGSDTVVVAVDYTLRAGVSVEVLSAQNRSGTAALRLVGNEIAQTILGNNGANTIDGGLSNDVLIGGGGADSFRFTNAVSSDNVDSIVDFESIDSIFLARNVFGIPSVNLSNFAVDASATTADHRIIYNQNSGQLFFDADGNGAGAAVLFALLTPGTPLTVANFEVA